MTVRTRFAPSPTGFMHIGGMRTALFNWLFARHHGGQFILRIDDTDQQRNMDEALGPILDAFRWLGLDWDEGPEVGGDCGPYFQSQRQHLYQAALTQLLNSGHAYRDFESPAETQAQREAAEKEKRQYVSSRTSLNLTPDQIAQNLSDAVPHVVRFIVPRDRRIQINDHVRGDVEWDCSLMPDPVIARNDGSPLYNFATVVDDAHLKITHVIRAEEHLSNTPVQVLLGEALGYQQPQWAHIPYVAAPGSKEKMSKRKISKYRTNPQFMKLFEIGDTVLAAIGEDAASDALSPVMVAYYQKVGFIPAGVLNALARLGWSLDDSTELLSVEAVTESFSLDRVIKSAAGFDPDKLMSFQAHWMGQLPFEERLAGCLPFLTKSGKIQEPVSETMQTFVGRVIELAADRIRIFGDILQLDEFFVADDQLTHDEKNFQKRVVKPDAAVDLLQQVTRLLSTLSDFTADALHDAVNSFVSERGLRAGDLFPALRLCVTGKAQGTDLFPTMELLGRDRVMARLNRSIGIAESMKVS
ncbi:MAG: glutamate--tRNA ligase [Planctomycetaceae bacterium]|nr:glutamate--tRNA ligase [Planctomycetaceae bacterium]